jgi:hypothetical protein
MNLPETPILQARLTSRDIRAVAARLAHPDDPLAEWHFEFSEWRKACAEFQQTEQEIIIAQQAPSALALRQHRYMLFLLLAHGEELALHLMQNPAVADLERTRLLEQTDAFLGTLTDSWHTWHGESLPEHRESLASFLA